MKNTLKHLFANRQLLLFFLVAFIYPGKYANGQGSADFSADVVVKCEFDKVVPKPMDGFLLSITDNAPPAKMIDEIKPPYWRISSTYRSLLERVESFGAKPIFLMSDMFRYPVSHQIGWRPAQEDKKGWADTVEHVFRRHKEQGKEYIYDLYNEPDGPSFFSGSEQQFFEVYKIAYDKIRSLPGGDRTLLSGPSAKIFDSSFIHHFLDYCLLNHIRLDILSWHEFRTGDDIIKLETDLRWVRENWINGKYAPLQIKGIYINEIIPRSDQYVPATILGYFYYLEKGGADEASKGCWEPSQPGAKTNCFNNSLDGLLDPATFGPHAAWWAYKYYNLSLKNRLLSRTTNPNVVTFANYDEHKVRILVGYFGDKKPGDVLLNVYVEGIDRMPGLKNRPNVEAVVMRIPDTGEQVINSVDVVYKGNVPVNGGKAVFSLPKLKLKEAYVVELH